MVSVHKTAFDAYVAAQEKIINDLKTRLSSLEAKYSDLLETNATLSNKISELEGKEVSSSPKLFSDLFKRKKPNTEENNILNAMRIEQKQEDKKSKNVVIFGTKFTEDTNVDKNLVKEISECIGFDPSKVKYIKRFKRKSNEVESTPLLVELEDKENKAEMLKLAKELRNDRRFDKIYINPDLTFAERELNKSLVALRNELNRNNDSSTTGYRYVLPDNSNETQTASKNTTNTKHTNKSSISAKRKSVTKQNELNSQHYSYLSFWYTNATSLENKIHLLESEVADEDPDFLLISETWFKETSVANLIGYTLFRKDRGTRGGGVCIFVKTSLKASEVVYPELKDDTIEHIWCALQIGCERILIGCFYRPPNYSKQENTRINSLIIEASNLVSKGCFNDLIIFGDFNYPAIKWTEKMYPEINPFDHHSQIFLNVVYDCFLSQMVENHTFQTSDGETTNTLDLILTSYPQRITDLAHKPPLGNSSRGHHILTLKYLASKSTEKSFDNRKFNYQRGKYDLFSNKLNSVDWEVVFDSKDVNTCYNLFVDMYHTLCHEFIPKKKLSHKHNLPWLTQMTKRLIREKKNLWFKYLASKKNTELLRKFKEAKKIVEKSIKEDLCRFETDLIKRSKTNPKLFYSYVNSKTNVKTHIRTLIDSDGQNVTDPFEICQILNKQFESVFNKSDETVIPPMEARTNKSLSIDPNLVFSVSNVAKVLSDLNENKSMGSDEINPTVLKRNAIAFSTPISILFIKSFQSSEVPNLWREANVTPLFKKGSRLSAKNYRPVSLTSIVCKIMEKLLKKPIMEYLLTNNLISSRQHGFMENKSCITNLLEILDFLTEAMNIGLPVDMFYLDFAKAFDSLLHKRLLFKLNKHGFDYKIIGWLRAFLSNRRQRVVMGNSMSEWVDVTSGVPQGSVLGPVLFIIFINDLVDLIKSPCELFADDTKFGEILDEPSKHILLQETLNKVSEWTRLWVIALNEDKCKVLHFGHENPHYKYTLNGIEIKDSDGERDLGIFFNCNLKWSTHINACVNKANSTLGLIKRTFKYHNAETISRLYKAFVRPQLEYVVQVKMPTLKKDIKTIESVQRRATKLVPHFRNLGYHQRLEKLNLTTLEARRIRGDLIQMFKFSKGFDKINWFNPVIFKNDSLNGLRQCPRSHQLTIERQLVKNCEQRHNFFVNRISSIWNRLPKDIVESNTINVFKNKLDKLNLTSYHNNAKTSNSSISYFDKSTNQKQYGKIRNNNIIPDLIFNFDYKNDLIHEKVNDFYCEIEETNISEMIYYEEII
ncbi:unnamed protein product [Brachionus calyciflorus]|uniref:Reverse transcriptase domain-containing protein n=1 Tax=Brachionus calyciflorus TaxID=104777 RepID=A0A814LDJ5_9BILA|nr:unnamed protein product [Brachionus calyciflorus]